MKSRTNFRRGAIACALLIASLATGGCGDGPTAPRLSGAPPGTATARATRTPTATSTPTPTPGDAADIHGSWSGTMKFGGPFDEPCPDETVTVLIPETGTGFQSRFQTSCVGFVTLTGSISGHIVYGTAAIQHGALERPFSGDVEPNRLTLSADFRAGASSWFCGEYGCFGILTLDLGSGD